MNEQQFNKKCRKEQVNIEEQKGLPEKEEKKTSEQVEVLANSSVEMSLKTDADLLRTSITPEPTKQTPHLNENFLLEPNGPQIIFQQIEEWTKEFMKKLTLENLNGPVNANLPGLSHQTIVD